jgi:peptidoglycan hydrolase-like protein with peptidoglycan-binding domain
MYSSLISTIAGFFFAPVLALSVASGASVALPVSASVSASPMIPAVGCLNLIQNLGYGSRDALSSGAVSELQNFLRSQQYFNVYASGFFGPLTLRATELFQAAHGVPSTGFVGPLTRAAIGSLSCGTTPPPSSGLYIQSLSPSAGAVGTSVTVSGSGFTSDNTILFGSGALVHVASNDGSTLTFTVPGALNPLCYYSGCMLPSQETMPGTYNVSIQNSNGTTNTVSFTVTSSQPSATPVTIYHISPTSGAVGSTLSITGFGFTASNIVHFGGGAITGVPIASSIAIACTTSPSCHGGINQTLTITVPSSIGPYCPPGSMCPMYMQLITPGTYTIYVQNDNGTSNSFSFTVTGTSPLTSAPSITGIDAPSTLALGSTGTWTVHASVPSGSTTTLHYAANWGDQPALAGNALVASSPVSQSSATFMHAYTQAGTYTAVFTVSDDSGQSSTVSSTITVTPLY